MRTTRWNILWLCLLALVPVGFLYIGRPGDDAQFHLTSWMQMLEGWRAGELWPAWAPHANYNLGEPRFYFYPPLSRAVGAVLLLAVPVSWLPGVFVWAMLVLAGLTTVRLSSLLLPVEDSRMAGLLGATSYYLVVVGLLRFAAAELFTAAMLPLALYFYLRLMNEARARNVAALALTMAALWMGDVPAAMAFAYALFFATLLEAMLRRSLRPLIVFALAEAGALALSSFYLLPALLARSRIASTSLLHFATRDFMLFHVPVKNLTPPMKYPLWGWALGGVVCAATLALRMRHESTKREHVRLLVAIAGAAVFFQLPLSLPLWRHLPQLGFVQFPYRFDCLLGAVLPVLCLLLARSAMQRRWLYAMWMLLFFVPLATKIAQHYGRASTASFTGFANEVPGGHAGCPEFETAGVIASHSASLPQVSPEPGTALRCKAVVQRWAPQSRVVSTASNANCIYSIALTYYPDWQLAIDGRMTSGLRAAPDGTTLLDVPAGIHRIDLRYVRPWMADAMGCSISLLALLLCAGTLLFPRNIVAQERRKAQRPHSMSAGVAMAAMKTNYSRWKSTSPV